MVPLGKVLESTISNITERLAIGMRALRRCSDVNLATSGNYSYQADNRQNPEHPVGFRADSMRIRARSSLLMAPLRLRENQELAQ